MYIYFKMVYEYYINNFNTNIYYNIIAHKVFI